MDRLGYDSLKEALNEMPHLGADIYPYPIDTADERFVTIKREPDTPAAFVLNLLDRQGFIYSDPRPGFESWAVGASHPLLKVIGFEKGAITFEDMNARSTSF